MLVGTLSGVLGSITQAVSARSERVFVRTDILELIEYDI